MPLASVSVLCKKVKLNCNKRWYRLITITPNIKRMADDKVLNALVCSYILDKDKKLGEKIQKKLESVSNKF